MRVTTAFKRVLCPSGITVSEVEFQPAMVVVTVKLTARKLRCPLCVFTTRAAYDRRPVSSSWRHLDLAAWRLAIRADLRRLECPTHGVRTEAVPFASVGGGGPSASSSRVTCASSGWRARAISREASLNHRGRP